MPDDVQHDVVALAEQLGAAGVHYVCCSMVDNGGINRVKCVPIGKLERAVRLGIGVPLSWSMAMSNDHFAQPDGYGGPSGDLRLKPDPAGQRQQPVLQVVAVPVVALGGLQFAATDEEPPRGR